MATSKKSDSHVTRIKATDKPIKAARPSVAEVRKSLKKSGPAKTVTTVKAQQKPARSGEKNWFVRGLLSFGGYFKGAWQELRKVRWPNTKATWSLTLAVLLFCAFFVLLILLLDALFKYVFELILK